MHGDRNRNVRTSCLEWALSRVALEPRRRNGGGGEDHPRLPQIVGHLAGITGRSPFHRWCRQLGIAATQNRCRGSIGRPCNPTPGRRRLGRRDEGSRSEEHTSELQSLMRISYAVFCLKKKKIFKHT